MSQRLRHAHVVGVVVLIDNAVIRDDPTTNPLRLNKSLRMVTRDTCRDIPRKGHCFLQQYSNHRFGVRECMLYLHGCMRVASMSSTAYLMG